MTNTMCAAVKTSRLGKFDLNPRGNLWVKDQNKFGEKLLSKMGWSQGKGLGKNENGITESLKVRMKLGNSGVGWSEKVPLGLESEEYDAVLENLNKKFEITDGEKSENDLKGLEQRSQQFKNRLHYQKFIKGKDVCRYSEKDMNSIFVTRKTNTELEPMPVKSSITNVDSCSTEDSAPDSVPMFKSQLSMKDYFAMKFKNKSGDLRKPNMEESQNVELNPGNEVSSRKRKLELKRSKKSKKIKLEQPDVSDAMAMAPMKDAVIVEVLSDGEIPPENIKEQKLDATKSKKSKLNNLEKLKSCLKIKAGNSMKYWFKQEQKEVSFNDSVSYKIIYDDEIDAESDFTNNETSELDTSLSCLEDNIYSDEEFIQSENSNQMGEDDSAFVELNGCGSESREESVQNGTSVQDLVEEEDNFEKPECFNLPKCEKSNYNTWLESQRIAIKMKLYKNMVKKIKKHHVLRTSNLLDIKGYGNWGF